MTRAACGGRLTTELIQTGVWGGSSNVEPLLPATSSGGLQVMPPMEPTGIEPVTSCLQSGWNEYKSPWL